MVRDAGPGIRWMRDPTRGGVATSLNELAREWLEWKRSDFAEHDVETDNAARDRLLALAGGQRTVPVLVEEGKVVQIGWQGKGCVIG
ncbi:MAG: glutaredoxin domain-containing protein [Candidatus Korobacteraceae bacterium]